MKAKRKRNRAPVPVATDFTVTVSKLDGGPDPRFAVFHSFPCFPLLPLLEEGPFPIHSATRAGALLAVTRTSRASKPRKAERGGSEGHLRLAAVVQNGGRILVDSHQAGHGAHAPDSLKRDRASGRPVGEKYADTFWAIEHDGAMVTISFRVPSGAAASRGSAAFRRGGTLELSGVGDAGLHWSSEDLSVLLSKAVEAFRARGSVTVQFTGKLA